MNDLTGYIAFDIDDESLTFPLPLYSDTTITGWGPGYEGEFEQHMWTPAAIATWERRDVEHRRATRRFGWLRRIRIPLPIPNVGIDEDAGVHRSRITWFYPAWKWASAHIPSSPGPRQRSFVTNTVSNYVEVEGSVEGLTFMHNIIRHPAMPSWMPRPIMEFRI